MGHVTCNSYVIADHRPDRTTTSSFQFVSQDEGNRLGTVCLTWCLEFQANFYLRPSR